ncbi:hypothetical protein CANINC_001786 [Pichia inconspicua]|uniref:Uncharacterized protein n=1 Tax=Pichia inconspicua TaxID=52247 RepID=A0A4T0X2W8_9ASCO|nr:hypothetical protein CANINC_001786 [[Candida] inconspicua]
MPVSIYAMDQVDEIEKVYLEFQAYDFDKSPTYKQTLNEVYNQYLIVLSDKDLEVRTELSQGIFNLNKIPVEDREQLQLQTKIFVFCSETDNILEVSDYQYWLAMKNPDTLKITEEPKVEEFKTTEKEVSGHIDDVITAFEPAEYTSNYQQVVDMIVNNKPIPGIKQIPKTILDPANASESNLAPRKKPWELKQEADDTTDP